MRNYEVILSEHEGFFIVITVMLSHTMNVPKINEIFFEYLAYWESGLQASRLAKILGQSASMCSAIQISRFERGPIGFG